MALWKYFILMCWLQHSGVKYIIFSFIIIIIKNILFILFVKASYSVYMCETFDYLATMQ